jgi:transcriptional regulator with XRE-family HTH domain
MKPSKRIKTLRTSIGLTQEELGNKLGVKKAAIQKYESGSIINLKVDTIKKLAEIFDTTPAYIMGWDKFDSESNNCQIKKEIRLAEILDDFLNEEDKELIFKTLELNEIGKSKLCSFINDLILIEKYKK